MSVINQVLKDLGARQSRSALQLADIIDLRSSRERLQRSYRNLAKPVLVVCILAVGAALLVWRDRIVPAVIPVAPVTNLAPAQPAVAEAAIIGAFDIESDATSLRLVMESDKPIINTVQQTFREDGGIDYLIGDTRLEVGIPELQQNRLIKSFTVLQQQQAVVVHVIPHDSALVFIEPGKNESGVYRTVIGARLRAETPAPAPVQAQPPQSVSPRASRPTKPTVADTKEKMEITRHTVPAVQAEEYYRRGLEALQTNRMAAAISDLRKAVALDPDMHAARELLALLLLRTGYTVEAYEELRQGMRLKPGHTAYARLHAQSLVEAGQPDEALRVLGVSEPYAAQQPDYLAFIAAVEQRLTLHAEAVGHYTAALSQQPARSRWWVGLAISLEGLGRTQDAVEAYRTALGGTELNTDLTNYARTRLAQLGG
ncbi:MAG TPA: tetratricopeptide repeat protein [Gammaproteobacteria bacterium]